MNLSWRRRLRRAWLLAGGTVAVLAIVLAAVMALGQLLLPLAAHYPQQVARFLSTRLQQPVSFTSMEGHWQASGPVLVLHDVHIGRRDGQPVLTLPSASVKLDFGALLWPSRHWVNLRLSHLRLRLLRDGEGRWHVAGFASSKPVSLADLPGNLWLDQLQVDIRDLRAGRSYHLAVPSLHVSNGGGEVRFAGQVRRQGVSAPVRLAGRVAADGARGRLYLALRQADLGAVLGGIDLAGNKVLGGRGSLALWLDWRGRQLATVTVSSDLRHLAVQTASGPLRVARLHGLVRYSGQGGKSALWVAPAAGGLARVAIDTSAGGARLAARMDDFDADGWLTLAALAPGLEPRLQHWLLAARPGLTIADGRVRWSAQAGLEALQMRFSGLHLAPAGAAPGVDGLHGTVLGDAAAVAVYLPKQPVTMDFARMFRAPAKLSSLAGTVVIAPVEGGWNIASQTLDVVGQDWSGQFRGRIRLPPGGGAPQLAVYAHLADLSLARAKQFLPVDAIPAHAVAWLDEALAGGRIEYARAVVRGDMGHWPFADHHGHFQADAHIAGLDLDYQHDWPAARKVTLDARFINGGMLAAVHSGEVGGIAVQQATASIPDLAHPSLILDVDGAGGAADLLDFVRQSPIGAAHADALADLGLAGKAKFGFAAVIPLTHADAQELALGGRIQLDATDLSDPSWGLALQGLRGTLRFDAHGLRADELHARLHEQPVTLALAVGGTDAHPDWPVAVRLRGRFSVQQLARGRPGLARLVQVAKGSAPFDIRFHVDPQAANPVHAKQLLRVRSNLQGIALDLPAPLHKPAQALLPLDLELGLPSAGAQLRLVAGNRLYARARLAAEDADPGAVAIRLGGGALQQPLPASGVRIRGSAAQLDLSGWVQRVLSSGTGAATDQAPLDIDIHARDTRIFGSDFQGLEIRLLPDARQWELAVQGPAMAGKLTVPRSDIQHRGIVARFQRLYWSGPAHGTATATADTATAIARPGTAPTTVAAASIATSPTTAVAAAADGANPVRPEAGLAAIGVAPAALPPMHLWVADLRLGDAHLGQARLESWPTAEGMHIDLLRTQSDSVHVSATGDWNGDAEASHTHLAIDFSAENLGRMLDAFGYEGVVVGGTTQAHLDATWPGAPSSFALANLAGTLKVRIGRGRIPEVEPGVGRLFGLMSIAELPRRLTMDFGGLFGKGFGFDSIRGDFRLADGKAWTSDLAIKGPSADITVSGSVDLRHHRYDQYVRAVPHVGNSLPVVGAVVAGPVGAAAGLAIQGLLGHGLNQAVSARYHITGPWSAPVITLLEKHIPPNAGVPAAAASALPPAAATLMPPAAASVAVPAPASSAVTAAVAAGAGR